MIESSLPQSEPVLAPGRPFGRQVRSAIGYSLLTALMLVTQTLVFVPAVLLHCAIRHGRGTAWTVLALSLAIASLYAITAPAAPPDVQKMYWAYLGGVTLALALPVMAAVPMVERGESFGRVLLFLLAGGMVGLALTESGSQLLLGFSPNSVLVAEMQRVMEQVEQFYRENKAPAELIRSVEQAGPVTIYLMPVQLMIGLIVAHVLSLMMYGRLRAWQNDPERPYLFRRFALPDWVLFAFLFGGLTPLTSGVMQQVAANVLGVVAFLYFLQGLAIFRSMLLAIRAGLIGTLFGWLLLAITMPFSGLALAVTGLFDSFFDFRHFKKRKDDSHESHSD